MSKLSVVVSCPIDTYSGYGARARDVVKALIALEKYDVSILSQRWGNTRWGYLKDHNEDDLASRIIPKLTSQPDIWIQITVPNEFQPVGKYNIGITAGMETTIVHNTWLEGMNRMDINLVSSKHSKHVFEASEYDKKDAQGNVVSKLKLEKPVEVLFEGVDINKYFKTETKANSNINVALDSINEKFCYLFVGHWLQGDFGHDRKNIGYMIKAFLETFKNHRGDTPALILKTQKVGSSIPDQESVLKKIDSIRKTVKGKKPNIYLLHGELSDSDVNELYNHTKVKAMISFAKGEGFGRPLLEFTTTGKPIIASGWSGQIDFLHKEMSLLIGGQLENVHPSAAQKDMIMEQAQWFKPNDQEVHFALKDLHKNYYKKYLVLGKKQRRNTLNNFTWDHMVETLKSILDTNLPDFPEKVELVLPKLDLPKLEKV